jgi:hypothetical protein
MALLLANTVLIVLGAAGLKKAIAFVLALSVPVLPVVAPIQKSL